MQYCGHRNGDLGNCGSDGSLYGPTLGIAPYSNEAADFAMETVMLHWTFPAYATYALPSLLFAFLFYNMKRPFSVSEVLCPVTGRAPGKRAAGVIDSI